MSDLLNFAAGADVDLTPDVQDAYGIGHNNPPPVIVEADRLDKAEFYEMFCDSHVALNETMGLFQSDVFPLDCVPVHPDEAPRARKASDAIYRMLERQGVVDKVSAHRWLLDFFPIMGYVSGKFAAMNKEIRARSIANDNQINNAKGKSNVVPIKGDMVQPPNNYDSDGSAVPTASQPMATDNE